jgi:hypothetical protein
MNEQFEIGDVVKVVKSIHFANSEKIGIVTERKGTGLIVDFEDSYPCRYTPSDLILVSKAAK